MNISCPNCRQELDADEDMAGTTVECPACNSQFLIPKLSPPPATEHPCNSKPVAINQDLLSLPRLFLIGGAVLFLSTLLAFTCFMLVLADRPRPWTTLGLVSLVLCLAGAILTSIGWAKFLTGRRKRKVTSLQQQLASVNAEEIPAEEAILPDVAVVRMGQNKEPAGIDAIGDIVLGRHCLGFLFRYKPTEQNGVETAGNYVALGVIGGAIMASSQRKQAEKANRLAAEAAGKVREAEKTLALSERAARNTESFVIPVEDIVNISMPKEGLLTISYGFAVRTFGVGKAALSRFSGWLEQTRQINNLPVSDPSPLSRQAVDQFAKDSKGVRDAALRDELSRIEGRIAVQKSLADTLDMGFCRNIRQLRNPSAVGLQVSRFALERIMDTNMSMAGAGCLAFPIGAAIILIAGACAGGMHEKISGFGVLMALMGFIGFALGLFILPIGLITAWVADAESAKEKDAGVAN